MHLRLIEADTSNIQKMFNRSRLPALRLNRLLADRPLLQGVTVIVLATPCAVGRHTLCQVLPCAVGLCDLAMGVAFAVAFLPFD